MPTALMPDGRKTYVDSRLALSVSLPDAQWRREMERLIRQALAEDPRELFIRVQGGGGYGAWCFWIQWGHGVHCQRTPAIVLNEHEHSPVHVLERLKEELSKLTPCSSHQVH